MTLAHDPSILSGPRAASNATQADWADSLYALQFVPLAHNGERLCYVPRNPNGPIVKVNADSGAVVP